MPLLLARTDLHLAEGKPAEARQEAQRLCQLSAATAERTWQALAREASARVAIAEQDWSRARDDIAQAQAAMSGFECPLAAWPVHATALQLYERIDRRDMAEMHRWQRDAVVLGLAESLPGGAPLRQIFVAACRSR
jgi:hypothetical protein